MHPHAVAVVEPASVAASVLDAVYTDEKCRQPHIESPQEPLLAPPQYTYFSSSLV